MKRAAIVTLYGNSNFGNKLQNYALQEVLKKNGLNVETLKLSNSNFDKTNIKLLNNIISIILNFYRNNIVISKYRNSNFRKFKNNYLNDTNKYVYYRNLKNISKKYDYFIVGSDQVFNPRFGLEHKVMFLDGVEKQKKISYSASFGVSNISKDLIEFYKNGLNSFKYISVREDAGKEIIKKIDERINVEVLLDPTLLLTDQEWNDIVEKPKMLKNNKFILNYFLGELSDDRKKEIQRVANENNCEIIDLLDKNSMFYECGPSEFLYLEKNAFLICTDSFHSSVFAILFNRPFIVFDREQKNVDSMNSRLDTLINKFKLKNRKFEGKITDKNLSHDYTEAYNILISERKKSEEFLKKALDIKE